VLSSLLVPFFSTEDFFFWKGVVGALILRRAMHSIPPTVSLYTVQQKLNAQDFRAPNTRYIFKEHIVCDRLYSAVHWDI
jgi:hypothetical protein